MKQIDDLTKTLDEGLFSSLECFFSMASSNGVKNVTLDCLTRKVHVEMYQVLNDEDSDDDYEAYFHSMMARCNMEDKAYGTFGMWKSNTYSVTSVAFWKKRIGSQLKELMEKGFIVLDDYTDADDSALYADELTQWGLADMNFEKAYCQLRKMFNFENDRFTVNKSYTGWYLQARGDILTQKCIQDFFHFVHVCQYVNAMMDELEGVTNGLSPRDQKILNRILGYVSRGDWREPANFDNVRTFLSELFEHVEFRDFFKVGRSGKVSDRVDVSMANVLGYLMSYQLLNGGSKKISIDFFGKDDLYNSINHGMNANGNQSFNKLIPLLDKYRVKVIV